MLSMAGSAVMLLLMSDIGKAPLLEMASIPLSRIGFSFRRFLLFAQREKSAKKSNQKVYFSPCVEEARGVVMYCGAAAK